MRSAAVVPNSLPVPVPSERKPPTSETSPPSIQLPTAPGSFGQTQFSAEAKHSPTARLFDFPSTGRLLNAREVAARLGVSERWVRDHTTRRSPKIRGMKLGSLVRYNPADVEEFMEKLATSRSSLQPRFGG